LKEWEMPKLAIHGGEKLLPEGHCIWPQITEEDREAVLKVLDRRVLWGGYAPEVTALQEEWASYVGTKHCLATNSGTAALHIAVAAAGIGPGDEVITSALTFVASALAIMQQNGIPVFVDINPESFNIDPKKIESKITDKTKAIIPIHLHGLPADMDEINSIARKYNLIVIEDACQAHGALYKGRKVGSLGDMAAFSLNGSKNLPGGEGGLFNTDRDDFRFMADKVKSLGEIIEEGIERDYNAFEVGWMYRYQELGAAFTRSRLKKLDEENRLRRENAEYFMKKLREIKGLTPPHIPIDRTSVYHLYRIKINPDPLGLDVPAHDFRAKVQKALRAEGLQAMRWGNRPVPVQSLFQDRKGYGSGCPWTCPYGKGKSVTYSKNDYQVTKKIVEETIVLHDAMYPPNSKKLLDTYVTAFQKLWGNLDELMDIKIDADEIYLRE
jgi:dTDP-4-amino-4,6-dideoxygalactose transaminase